MSQEIKIGGIARQNQVQVGGGEFATATFDRVGRQLTTPYQVRDLVATAIASTATLAEVTLLAGSTSIYHDLLEITCANTSTAIVRLSLRDNLSGGVVKTFLCPATNTITELFPVPVPQNEASNSWTIQNAGAGDISGTDVTVSATFIKNI